MQDNCFLYQRDQVFNGQTYLNFLQQQIAPRYRRRGAILVQDNASYHKDGDVWTWFRHNRHWLVVKSLPPYSPQFNPTQRMWQHTRKNATYSRSFLTVDELGQTLIRVFGEMQSKPETISAYLQPFLS